ncbi:major facilitator superfamily domain-containing protein [Trichoderma evansii]
MGLIMTSTCPSADISITISPEESNLEQKQPFEKTNTELVTIIEQGLLSPGQNAAGDAEPKLIKSLSFKLAFIGIAASLFTIAGDLNGTSLDISDVFGRKPPLYVSLGLFFIGSVVFAVARNMKTIIAGRILQGLGGGEIDVLAQVILADMTTLEERSKYIGLMAIPMAIGNIMGPIVGALFSTFVSWRWIAWINLPIIGMGTSLVFFFLKFRPIPLEDTLAQNLNQLDWVGMTLIIVGVTLFVMPLSWAGSLFPWASWQTLFPLLLGATLLVVFLFYETKPAAPIMPHRLFHTRTGNAALMGGFIHGMILVSLLQYMLLLLQVVKLETAVSSAVSLLPTVIVSVFIAAVSMMMVPFFGGYVWLLRLSWAILTLGTGLLALFKGIGVSLLRLNLLPVQASVKNIDDTGLAIGQLLTIRMFGGLVGLTISSAIFNNVFSESISNTAVQLTGALAPLKDSSNAVNFIETLRSLDVSSTTLDKILNIYLNCFRTIFYTMTGLSGLGLLNSMFLREIDLSKGIISECWSCVSTPFKEGLAYRMRILQLFIVRKLSAQAIPSFVAPNFEKAL